MEHTPEQEPTAVQPGDASAFISTAETAPATGAVTPQAAPSGPKLSHVRCLSVGGPAKHTYSRVRHWTHRATLPFAFFGKRSVAGD
jgi:hypothetical protein